MSEKETTTILRTPSSNTLTTKRPKVNIPEGKLLGDKLKIIEREWVNNDFKISDQEVRNIIKN